MTICLKVILQNNDIVRWGFSNSPLQYGYYIQTVIVFHWVFLLPTKWASLYCFMRIYTMIYATLFPFSFSCFEHSECLPVISWFWKFYVPIWALSIFSFHFFLEVIYPRCNPDTIIIIWNMRNISTHSGCLFLYAIFSYIALYIIWKPPHAQCKHKRFLNFGFGLITYISFPFSFSLLYNSSSFYQCLHFLWHLVMYKLLIKILRCCSPC